MDKITELLEKRDRDRRAKLEELQELKNKDSAANEGVDYFDSTFNEKVREIQNNLNNVEAGDINLPNTFSKIGTSLQELQRYLSTSTFFLNDRKVQKCQETLKDLGTRLDDKKSQLCPKKKFGFRNKTVEKPVQLMEILDETDSTSVDTSKKIFEFTASDKKNELIYIQGDDANHHDITIANLNSCILRIDGHPGSMHLKNIQNCLILSGPISRSVFAENCTSTTFAIACQQLRLHSSTDCKIYLHVTSRGIIEDANQIQVAPYNWNYDGIEKDYEESGLPKDRNYWNNLGDFNWLSAEQHSPNWMEIPLENQIQDWETFVHEWKIKSGIQDT